MGLFLGEGSQLLVLGAGADDVQPSWDGGGEGGEGFSSS